VNPDELEDILDRLLQGVQDVLQSGEQLSDDFMGQLAETIRNVSNEIDELRSQGQNQPPEEPPQGEPPSGGAGLTHVSNDAHLLWVLSGSQPQAFISYLRSFPTPATQSLLNNPAQLNATIEHLSNRIPQFPPQEVDGIPHADLQSSNIWGAAYDPRSGKMKVRFQGGSEYEYDGVPKNIFNAFIKGNAAAKTDGENQYGRWWKSKSPSLGAAMNQYIKGGNFPYRKIR
jgi:hypothetical protein